MFFLILQRWRTLFTTIYSEPVLLSEDWRTLYLPEQLRITHYALRITARNRQLLLIPIPIRRNIFHESSKLADFGGNLSYFPVDL
jgi:hypothetical protein